MKIFSPFFYSKEYCVNMERDELVDRISAVTAMYRPGFARRRDVFVSEIKGDQFYIVKGSGVGRGMRPKVAGRIAINNNIKRVHIRIAPGGGYLAAFMIAALFILSVLTFSILRHMTQIVLCASFLLASQYFEYYRFNKKKTELRRLIEEVLLE